MQKGHEPMHPTRFKSVRSYRRMLDHIMREAYEGRRPPEDVAKFAAATRVACEMLMSERLMGGNVIEQAEDQAVDALPVALSRAYVRQRITRRYGVDRRGMPIDDTSEMTEGPALISAEDVKIEI